MTKFKVKKVYVVYTSCYYEVNNNIISITDTKEKAEEVLKKL